MPAYLQNTAFGTKAFACTSLAYSSNTATPIYVGQAEGATTTAKDALAIDLSRWTGNYKGRYTVRLQTIEDFDVTGTMTYLDFTLHFLPAEDSLQTASKNYITSRIAAAKLKKAKTTPLEFTLPSIADDTEKFVRLELATDATTVKKGALLVTIEPSEM